MRFFCYTMKIMLFNATFLIRWNWNFARYIFQKYNFYCCTENHIRFRYSSRES